MKEEIMNTIPCGPSRLLLSHVRIPGSRHRQNLQPCEDSVLLDNDGDYLFCGLADGQSGAPWGAEGGRACLEAVSGYIRRTGIHSLIHARFPDELPCMFAQAFRRKLLALAEEKQCPLQDFASTLLAVAVDLKSGAFILLHLGDGCALSAASDTEPGILSPPENALAAHHTWLTTSDNAVAHLRVAFGSLKPGKRLLLLSDGAVCFCRGRNISWRAKDVLRTGSQQLLRQLLAQSNPEDDATCILLDCLGQAPS